VTRPRGIAWLAGLACLGFAVLPAGAATDKIVIDEFLLRCADARPDGAFVELVAAGPGQTFDGALGVRLLGPSGATVSDLPGVFASRAGQPWAEGRHFLIATAAFEPLTGVAPDTVFSAPPAGNGGSIVIYRRSGTTFTVVSRVDYSSSSSLAATPPPGRSAFRFITGLYHWSPDPSPTRSDGVLARAPGCFADPRRPIRITELATRCGSGDRSGGFVEIAPTADDQVLDSDLTQARRELTGEERVNPEPTAAEQLTEDQRWEPVPESVGHKAPTVPAPDEQTFAEELVEEGVEDAEQDQMVKATRQSLKRDKI